MNKIFTNIGNIIGIFTLIAGILLCSSAPLIASAEMKTCDSAKNTHSGMVSACGDQHSTGGKHTFNFISSVNFLFSLLSVGFVLFVVFSRKLFTVDNDSVRLNIYQYIHRVFIKPKLENFLRWLNLLGGSVALSV